MVVVPTGKIKSGQILAEDDLEPLRKMAMNIASRMLLAEKTAQDPAVNLDDLLGLVTGIQGAAGSPAGGQVPPDVNLLEQGTDVVESPETALAPHMMGTSQKAAPSPKLSALQKQADLTRALTKLREAVPGPFVQA